MAKNVGINKWYVNASYPTLTGCRGHEGAIITMGSATVPSFSRKQEINAKSLTKAEVIGVNDALQQTLWTRYFLECQHFKVGEKIVFQDNKSTMVLKKNGKAFISKRTNHAKVENFFITDKIVQKEV